MTCKFNIGDTVQVVKCVNPCDYPLNDGFKVGHRGKVISYDRSNVPHFYKVERKCGEFCSFTPNELKLIKRKTKNKNKGD